MKNTDYPVTCIRWKPHQDTMPKNILVSVAADGKITHWHTATGKALHTMEEKDNPIMCLDFNPTGQYFATAGNDKRVRLYDDNTKTLLRTMQAGGFDLPGHSNRIFAVNFHKENLNLLISGGWDNTIQFYDVRQGVVVNSLYGPHICGDAIDTQGYTLLTGSWSIENQLQMWDIRMFKLIENLKWDKENNKNSTYIYAAQFNKNPGQFKMYGVGGSNNNIFRVFDNSTDEKSPIISSKYMYKSCYSLDFSNDGTKFVYGCGDGIIRLLNINKNN